MELSRVVYVSDAVTRMTDAQLTELVAHCRINNEARGISGLLLYSGGHFMQVLEGNPLHLKSLLDRISMDRRHHAIRELINQSTDRRLFPDWGMQLVNTERANALDRTRVERLLLRLRLRNGPAESNEALLLLQEFRQQAMAA